MQSNFLNLSRLSLVLGLCAAPLAAQTVHPGDVTIEGDLTIQVPIAPPTNPNQGSLYVEGQSVLDNSVCMGNSCSASESIPNETVLRLKYTNTWVEFEDTSGPTLPDRDWTLRINDANTIATGGIERFSVEDRTAGTIPFTIEGGAPANALWLDNTGNIGLGTSLPQANLHISDTDQVKLRMDVTGATPEAWELLATGQVFAIAYNNSTTVPFGIFNDAPTASFIVDSAGKVGLGTVIPEEKLHIVSEGENNDAFALFEAQGSGSDSAFRLKQNGIVPSTWEFRNQQDSGRLNVGLAGGNTPFKIDNAANNNLLRLGRNGQPGEVNITGTLVVNNTALNVPDYVFADDYALRPLAEVRDFIAVNSHLPDVPSEAEIKANGVDMTAMQMTLLKKVEELTLYVLAQEDTIVMQQDTIAMQQDTIAKQQAELSELQVMKVQMARIEALLSDQVK